MAAVMTCHRLVVFALLVTAYVPFVLSEPHLKDDGDTLWIENKNNLNKDKIKKSFGFLPQVRTNAPRTYAPLQTRAPHTNAPLQTGAPNTNVPLQTNAPQTNLPVAITVPVSSSMPNILPTQSRRFNCTGKSFGFQADPSSCIGYYICTGNIAVHVECTAGLLFNPTSKFCDYAQNVKCLSQPSPTKTLIQQPSTQPSTTVTTVIPTTTPVPTRSPTTTFVPPVTTKTPKVTTARPTTTRPTTAPPTPAVTVKPTTQAPLQTPQPSSGQQGTGYDQNFCRQRSDGLFHDPKDCTHYYQCAYGGTFYEPCPPNLVFNDNKQACDYALNVPACVPVIG